MPATEHLAEKAEKDAEVNDEAVPNVDDQMFHADKQPSTMGDETEFNKHVDSRAPNEPDDMVAGVDTPPEPMDGIFSMLVERPSQST